MLKVVTPTQAQATPYSLSSEAVAGHQPTPFASSAPWLEKHSPLWTVLDTEPEQVEPFPQLDVDSTTSTPHPLYANGRSSPIEQASASTSQLLSMGKIPQQAGSSTHANEEPETTRTQSTKSNKAAKQTVFDGVVITIPAWLSAYKRKHGASATRPQDVSLAQSSVDEDDRGTRSRSSEAEFDQVEDAASTSGDIAAPSTSQEHRILRERPQASAEDHARSSTRSRPTRNVHRNIEGVETIDRLLEAQVAPAVIIPAYAKSYVAPDDSLRLISSIVTATSHTDTGARSSWRSYSMPRYSRIAMFKERLDTRLGPGDLNRGLYRRPKPVGGHIQQERGASDVMDGDESNVDVVIRGKTLKRRRSPEIEPAAMGTDDSDAATTEDMRPTKRHIGRHERDLRPISQEVGERGLGSDSED